MSTSIDPSFITYNVLDLVLEHDPDHYERDVVYRMSNDREYYDTDNTDSGIYDGT